MRTSNNKYFIICVLLFTILVLSSCSTTKHLPVGDHLYVGATVKINPDSTGKVEDQKSLKDLLESKTRPQPNKKFLGMPFKLWMYNLAGEPTKNKGFRNWLRNKVGEPPVLASSVRLKLNNDILTSNLISTGYLQAEVIGDTLTKKRKTKAIYIANTGIRYKIDEVKFPEDTTSVNKILQRFKENSLIKRGQFYDLEVFKNERIRIDNDLKENGYFYFNPDYLLIQADSTIGKNLVNIQVIVKPIAPIEALQPYKINEINIYPNYILQRDSIIRSAPPIEYKGLRIIDRRATFKPQVFDRLIFFKPGETYNRKDHNLSLNRIVNVGMFKFVKADFTPIDSLKSNRLDLNFYLTPLKKNSLSFQTTVTNKSNNFVGSEIRINQLFRNVFKGAEQLSISVSGGMETQVGGTQGIKINSTSFSAETKLSFPRFVVPFLKVNSTSAFVPKTNISLAFQTIKKGDFYSMNSIKSEIGYIWKENIYKEHILNPISITYVLPPDTSKQTYKDNIIRFPGLETNLEKVFIIGSNYSFSFNNQLNTERKNNIFFTGTAETAGNLVSLFANTNAAGQKIFAKTPLSKFYRLEVDFRDYYKIRKEITWANRLVMGYGHAFGNSTSLPFVRQFFAGGSNDVRAFPARSIGPGSYNSSTSQFYADQGGDIKLMLNSELRFKIFSIIHGALFVDAGNIWLRKEDPTRPGSGFKGSNILKEMAVGGGVGLRIDAQIFVVRFDLAMPFRVPYLPENQRWVIKDIDFGSKVWRKNNLILNIGIGYPF